MAASPASPGYRIRLIGQLVPYKPLTPGYVIAPLLSPRGVREKHRVYRHAGAVVLSGHRCEYVSNVSAALA